MIIRKAKISDIKEIMQCLEAAKQFMRNTNNMTQWTNGYPSEALILEELNKEELYVCLHNEKIVGTFCFTTAGESTYDIIENGKWLNDKPFGVIHRLASNGTVKGVGKACMDWCFEQIGNIKVDTHADNIPMQHIFEKLGYTNCGIIYLANGDSRIAYQKGS